MVAIRYTLTDNDEELTPSSVNMQRTLKAVNKNQARFFNVTQNSDLSPTGNITSEDYFNSIDNNGVTFTRQPDGTFTVAGRIYRFLMGPLVLRMAHLHFVTITSPVERGIA